MKDGDKYIWLLAHMGRVQAEAKRWNPDKDKPLLIHLQDFIDREAPKAGAEWIKKQRAIFDITRRIEN